MVSQIRSLQTKERLLILEPPRILRGAQAFLNASVSILHASWGPFGCLLCVCVTAFFAVLGLFCAVWAILCAP